MGDLVFIDPQNIRLDKDENGSDRLVCTKNGSSIRVSPRRLFPFSLPHVFISLVDDTDEEIAVLREIKSLPRAERTYVEAFLEQYYFVPRITEILDLKEEYGISRWTVRTDHGQRSFDVRRRSVDIHVSGKTRVLIKDSDDNMYEIPDYTALPPHSRALLEGEI